MITFDWRLTKGTFEGSKIAFNSDLIQHAKENNLALPMNYFPAILNRDYLLNDFAKFRKSYNWCPRPEAWRITREAFLAEFSLRLISRPLTFDEAISRIELSSSPGFPWRSKYATKRDVIENELPLIRSIVERVFATGDVDYVFDGQRYTNVFWLTSPKSEIRPIEKVNNVDKSKRKTRTFMCGDLICHIVGFMLYKEQNDNFLDLALSNSWSAIGLSPWYGGWNSLVRILLRNSPHSSIAKNFHCYDASHMEASVSDAMQDLIYEARNQSLPSYCEIASQWFYLNVTNSLIIDIDGFVVMKNGKNPSGSFNTLTDNTMALIIVFLYCISCFYMSLEKVFEAYHRIACKMLGDDSIFEECPELADLEMCANELGFNLLPESEPGPLTQCSFLSSKFNFNTRYCSWIQYNNWEKTIANVFFNFKARSWRLTYAKLCAVRQIFYAYDDKRVYVDKLLNYILSRHDDDMKREDCKELTYAQARSQLMSDKANKFLIFGLESTGDDTVIKQSKKFWAPRVSIEPKINSVLLNGVFAFYAFLCYCLRRLYFVISVSFLFFYFLVFIQLLLTNLTMSASVSRSEKILNRLASQDHLTPAAVEWLKTTLDPFHDNPLNCTGVPDGQLGNSVVQCIKSSVTIAKPVGLADGALWDCHVSMAPFFFNSASRLNLEDATLIQSSNMANHGTASLQVATIAPITIRKYPTGYSGNYSDPMWPVAPPGAGFQTDFVNLNANYTSGDYRIISQGFEVLNTTNALDVQGLCTVYRTPVPSLSDASAINYLATPDPAAVKGANVFSGLCISRLPLDTSQALRLPNTKQWLAKEGCYVVGHLNDPETVVHNNSFIQPYFRAGSLSTTVDVPVSIVTPSLTTISGSNYYRWPSITWSKCDFSGAFFTGLKETTTLTINWNVYIERFPSEDESDLIVIAKPSPDYCPMAFELYKAIAMSLPVGVMQKENGLGDWFRDAVSTASEFISPIAAMIPHPAAQAVSGISRAIGGMAKRQESQSPYVSEQAEKAFVSRPRLARSPVRSSRTIKEEVKKEAKKEAKKEIKPFLKRSTMSVMPSAKKAGRK